MYILLISQINKYYKYITKYENIIQNMLSLKNYLFNLIIF